MLEVICIPVLEDNYVWLLRDSDTAQAAVIDPAVGEPVLERATAHGLTVAQIWNTHWHPDHCDGNAAIKSASGCVVHAPAEKHRPIPAVDRLVSDGDVFPFGQHRVEVIGVPGHTLGHVAYHLPDHGILFTGDTLFAAGCGKVLEGTARQMWTSLQRLMTLPAATRVYAAHEYTMTNLRFAQTADPANAAIGARLREVAEIRRTGRPSLPTTIQQEKLTNPFCRAGNVAAFVRLREEKDLFRCDAERTSLVI